MAHDRATRFDLYLEDVVDRLKTVDHVVGGKNADALAKRVLLSADERGHVTAWARTTLDTVVADVQGTGTPGGRLIVDRDRLTKVVGAMPKPKKTRSKTAPALMPATIDASTVTPTLTVGTRTVSLPRLDADLALPCEVPTPVLTVDGELFRALAANVATALGVDDTLSQFTPLQVVLRSRSITLVASDRYRAAMAKIPAQHASRARLIKRIMPLHGATMAKAIGKLSGPTVTVGMDDSGVSFTSGGTTFVTTPLDVAPVQLEQVFAWDPAATIKVNRAELVEECKIAAGLAKVAGDGRRLTRLTFQSTSTGGSITATPVVSEREEDVAAPSLPATVTGFTGTGFVDFQSVFLWDALGSADTTRIEIGVRQLHSSATSVMFSAVPDADGEEKPQPVHLRHVVATVGPRRTN